MKKILVLALSAMLFLPAYDSGANPADGQKSKAAKSVKVTTGKKKPKKNATKSGKPKKKYVYRPGARQN